MKEILFETRGVLGLITLNRPKALNALTLDMIHAMTETLGVWAEDANIQAVAIRGAGDRAFSAGGDIRALYDLDGDAAAYIAGFFRDEYRLNRIIFRYPKPYVALIDGIAMGGGVGVSVNGSLRIASEATLFAMPETGIGMFPDVGGSYFLARCPGEIGMYLGLTGARLKAADCVRAGICDAYIPDNRHDAAIGALADGRHVSGILEEFADDPGAAPLDGQQAAIDRCFVVDSVEAIQVALENEGGEWAESARAALFKKSPLALKVALRQLRAGRALDFEDCMRMEYRLSQRIVPGHDFREGVRAVVVDKDNRPGWNPPSLAEVTDDMVEACFASLGDNDLTFPGVTG